jgi:uncharacterized protein (DUF305 family)
MEKKLEQRGAFAGSAGLIAVVEGKMVAMNSEFENAILEVRERAAKLDEKLNSASAPYLKNRVKMASYMSDDAVMALRLSEKAQPKFVSKWIASAQMSLLMAKQLLDDIQQTADAYGGPENIEEIG